MKRVLTFAGTLILMGSITTGATATTTVRKEPVILVYHSIEPKSEKKESKMQEHYHIYPENFRAQMQYLKDNGYTPIPMKVYLDHLKHDTEIPKKAVVLTFDDGWKNQYDYAYPILKEFGYTGTFYIIAKSVGAKSYVSWDNIKEMKQAGMDIQSHTNTHANLTKVDIEKIKEELMVSKKTIEEKIGYPVTMLAYPYYGMSKQARDLVASAGWAKYKNSKEVMFALTSQEAVNNKNPFSSKRE
jgi:peptidoglycan/xylan/chitin deacetylase (PgdA/CDA1 family)